MCALGGSMPVKCTWHMQSERRGWLDVMANKHVIHSADPRDAMDLFAVWLCVQSNVQRLLLFMCLLSKIAAYMSYSTALELLPFYCVCIQQKENICKFNVRLQHTGERGSLYTQSKRQCADFTQHMKWAHAELVAYRIRPAKQKNNNNIYIRFLSCFLFCVV